MENFARPTTKNSFSEQLLDLCHGDSFLVWNLLSIENAKLCRLKYYLPYVGSMMQYNKTLWFLIETIHLRGRAHTKNSTWSFQKGWQISSQFLTSLNCWKPISVHCTGLGCLKAVLRMRLTQLCVCFWLWDAYYVSGISIVGCTTLRKDTVISGYLLNYLNPTIFPCFDTFSQFLTILT